MNAFEKILYEIDNGIKTAIFSIIPSPRIISFRYINVP